METTATAPSRLDVSKGPAQFGRESPAFRLLVWSLVGVDVAILVSGVARSGLPPITGSQMLLWGTAVAVVGLASVRIWPSLVVSLDLPLLLAMGLLFGPLAAGLVALTASMDPRELRGELSISRAIGNRAQNSLAVMAGASAFDLAGGYPWPWPAVVVLALTAVLVYASVNVLLGALLSWFLGVRPVGAWKHLVSGSWITFALCFLGFGFLCLPIAQMYAQIGAGSLLLLSGPLILSAEVFSRGVRLERTSQVLEAKDEAIRGLSRQIAEERLDERLRIAASLHDDVIQGLHNVTLYAQVIRRDMQLGKLLQLEDDVPALVTAAQQAADLTRDVIRDLRGSPIGRLGLVQTLTAYARELSAESGVRIECRFTSVRVGPTTQLLIYQVAREALVNAVSHAKASRILISLIDDGSRVLLTVVDDGAGFESQSKHSGHFGLELMRERAALSGGSLNIEASPGLGTSVHAQFKNRE